jgi:hypothetical protein
MRNAKSKSQELNFGIRTLDFELDETMKKDIIFLFAFLALVHSRLAMAQPALGFWGGLNRASLKGDAPEDASYGTRVISAAVWWANSISPKTSS